MAVQNNFNSKNGGNFADRQINNAPPKQPMDKVLINNANQSGTGIKKISSFNSKVQM